MKNINTSFSILFETPYWIGIFERNDDEGYSVSKFVFGKEPTGPELYNFIVRYYPNRLSYSKPNEEITKITRKKINPKRRQREATKAMADRGVSTKAQEALKLQYEEKKHERKELSKLRKQELEKRKFILKQEKKKQKKRGH
ncbi:YjdF family protein [Wukongibacter baidiensis]|uniref:YjdF family protein n=1 Tax=Wukongibacter baidiensis TaxID=1723361 RepID=UPI003D7F6BCD